MNSLYILLLMSLWGLLHSLLASHRFKAFLTTWLGLGWMRAYRLFYNLFSLVTFLPILYLTASLPDAPLYIIPTPFSYLMLFGQGIAILLLLIGVLQTDALAFIGLRQFLETQEPPSRLVTNGLYRYVRHPLYSAGLLFLWLTPLMTRNLFTLYLTATLYLIIGAHFEEKKLLREFGQAYADYRARTPMLIPRWK